MKKTVLHYLTLFSLALLSLTSSAYAQGQESPNNESKVTIIKKTKEFNNSEKSKIDQNNSSKAALGVRIEKAPSGVKILSISNAAKEAGLQEGDIIVSFDEKAILEVEQLQNAVKLHKIGDRVKVGYLREGKTLFAVVVLKAAMPEYYTEKRFDSNQKLCKDQKHDPCQKLEELCNTAFLGVYVHRGENDSEISDFVENTAASKSRLKVGDIIKQINGEHISDYDKLISVLKKYKPGQMVKIRFDRNGKTEKTRIRLGSLADRDPAYTQKLELCCNAKTKIDKNEIESPVAKAEIIVELFPNPAAQIIHVNFNTSAKDPVNISIYNIEGKELLHLQLNSNQGQYSEQINVEKLPKGIYLLSIRQGNKLTSRQFSKI